MERNTELCLLRIGVNNRLDSRIILKNGISVFGRNESADVTIESTYCSRSHCVISIENNKINLRDLNSSNGTFVNNIICKNEKVELNIDDIIGFGCMATEEECRNCEDYYVYTLNQYKYDDYISLDSDDENENKTKKPDKPVNNSSSKAGSIEVDDEVICIQSDSDENADEDENQLQMELSQRYVANIKKEVDELEDLLCEIELEVDAYKPTYIKVEPEEPKLLNIKKEIVDIGDYNSDEEDSKFENWRMKLSQNIKIEREKDKDEGKPDVEMGNGDFSEEVQGVRKAKRKRIIDSDASDDMDQVQKSSISERANNNMEVKAKENEEHAKNDMEVDANENLEQVSNEDVYKIQKLLKRRYTISIENESDYVVHPKQMRRHSQCENAPEDLNILELCKNTSLTKISNRLIADNKNAHRMTKITDAKPLTKRSRGLSTAMTSKKCQETAGSKSAQQNKKVKNVNKDDRKAKLAEIAAANKKNEEENIVPVANRCKAKVTWDNRGAFLVDESLHMPKPKHKRKSKVQPVKQTSSIQSKKNGLSQFELDLQNQNDLEKAEKQLEQEITEELIKKQNPPSTVSTANSKSSGKEIYLGRRPKQRISHIDNKTTSNTNVDSTTLSSLSTASNICSYSNNSVNNKQSDFENKSVVEMDWSEIQIKSILKSSSSSLTSGGNRSTIKKSVKFSDKKRFIYFDVENGNTTKRSTRQYRAEPPSKSLIQYSQNQNQNQILLMQNTDSSKEYHNLISEITDWSTELLEQNSNIPMENPVLLPILQDYESVKQYQDVMIPLMKLELWSSILMDYKTNKKYTKILVNILSKAKEQRGSGYQYIFQCKTNNNPKIKNGSLVIINFENIDFEFFAYVTNYKHSTFDRSINFELECHASYKMEMIPSACQKLYVRPVSYIRPDLVYFYVVYSLSASPLMDNILHPLLNSIKPTEINPIKYTGFDELNPEQLCVLTKIYRRCLDSQDTNITLLDGPPGTGKSRVIVNLILQLIYGVEVMSAKRILLCAHSNAAVDVIAKKLMKVRSKMSSERAKFLKLVRIGIFDKIDEEVRGISVRNWIARNGSDRSTLESLANEKKTLQLKLRAAELSGKQTDCINDIENIKRQISIIDQSIYSIEKSGDEIGHRNCLSGANIICTTLNYSYNVARYIGKIDVCIVDEATQCTEPSILFPLHFGISALVLVGDTKQLGPTVISKKAQDYGLSQSIFTRIQNSFTGTIHKNPVLRLTRQYRMHSEICHWPSKFFYDGLLTTDKSINYDKCPLNPYTFIDLEFNQNKVKDTAGISNDCEADFVVELLTAMTREASVKQYSYGIITPYADQREQLSIRMKKNFKSITVNTIDSYQGQERDVIIISIARTSGIGFLALSNRLNVALTRAKKCVVLCGNFNSFKTNHTWSSLLGDAQTRNCYYKLKITDNITEFFNKTILKRK